MPLVDLSTFDEHFATRRRLTPVSRTILEQAGLANHILPIFAFIIYLTCIRGREGRKPCHDDDAFILIPLTRPLPPDALGALGDLLLHHVRFGGSRALLSPTPP
jgi:hypothetical protein